jgi:hypothetical protein
MGHIERSKGAPNMSKKTNHQNAQSAFIAKKTQIAD